MTQREARFTFNDEGFVIPVEGKGLNVTIIAAMDSRRGIGKNNEIPWNVSADMQQFKRLTTGNPVIMGRSTFESLGCKPLPKRLNIVLSRDPMYVEKFNEVTNLKFNTDLADAVAYTELYFQNQRMIEDDNTSRFNDHNQVFIIGGAQIYAKALELNLVNDMVLTRFSTHDLCDTFFPLFDRTQFLEPVTRSHDLDIVTTMQFEYWQRKQN
jgi:dihydrofolate reductase